MKRNNRKLIFLTFCVGACCAFFCSDLSAAEKATQGRKIYDTVMLWVNFSILVVIFVKYARKPLMEALRGVVDKIAGELNDIKQQRLENEKYLVAEESKIKDIQSHLDEIQTRIIEMGEKEKAAIIEQAKAAAEKMITDAEAYARHQIEKARKELTDEMVDIAISMVEENLAKEISQEDDDKLINEFLVDLDTTKTHLN